MKRIIEHGRIDPDIRTFACRHCSCVFEASRDDYEIKCDRNELYYISDCPECDHKAYSYETVKARD